MTEIIKDQIVTPLSELEEYVPEPKVKKSSYIPVADLTSEEKAKRNERDFWQNSARGNIFKLYLQGKKLKEISKETGWRLGNVQRLITHDIFLKKYARFLSITLFRYQSRKIQILDEALDLLRDRAKATINELPPSAAWKELMQVILQQKENKLQIKDPKILSLFKIGSLKISTSRETVKSLEKEFGLPSAFLNDDDESDESKESNTFMAEGSTDQE